MRRLGLLAVSATLAGCAALWGGRDETSQDFDKETIVNETRVKEDRAHSALARLEASLADYIKTEKKIPQRLEKLIPKYLAEIPPVDLPVCGPETAAVKIYPASALRDGQVNGVAIEGGGGWGYVFNDHQVVVFVDCLKPSSRGVPWYKVRGVF